MSARGAVRAVVVHHNRFGDIAATARGIAAQGIAPEHVLVVDNSTAPDADGVLARLRAAGHPVLTVPNRGYGAAANAGLDRWLAGDPTPEFVLLATHETRLEPGALAAMLGEARTHPRCAVVGPLLATGDGGATVWSAGGYLRGPLGLPRHRDHLVERAALGRVHSRDVEWLDGCCLLVRGAALGAERFDEGFFLYMEEVDLQLRLRSAGWTVRLAGDAVARQESDGVPDYYGVRNIQRLNRRAGRPVAAVAAGLFLAARQGARALLRGRGGDLGPIAAGLADGLLGRAGPGPRAADRASGVVLVNPLGRALAHYAEALEETLGSGGVRVRTLSVQEPSASGTGRAVWLASHLVLLWRARRVAAPDARILTLWPVLGYWDLLLARALAGPRAAVVLHDPVPLVRAVGYGRIAAAFVSRVPRLAAVVVHSREAAAEVERALPSARPQLLPHPMLVPAADAAEAARDRDPAVAAATGGPRGAAPKLPARVAGGSGAVPPAAPAGSPAGTSAGTSTTARTRRPVVRVLGQYKAGRDTTAMGLLAESLGAEAELRVTGRGWPRVAGWRVDERFVDEAELDALIRGADTVVIPYERFFQSGIAVRCLELGTPFVGPGGSHLEDLLGAGSPLLVGDGWTWDDAVRHALRAGRGEIVAAGRAYHLDAEASWAGFGDLS
ncbi:hypothetical protein ACX8Z9_03115 [Arthrobacter halodurans]|uniref:Glycosyltransferase, GT2 family n=1 Tax=Arthrobacter halodurans TaxID=516699 RepID=A0ABV4UJZ2_9MICC